MPTIKVPISELSNTASELAKASKEIFLAISNVEKMMTGLQVSWDDASKQPFFQSYKIWRKDAQGTGETLSLLARELDGIAKRYEQINK